MSWPVYWGFFSLIRSFTFFNVVTKCVSSPWDLGKMYVCVWTKFYHIIYAGSAWTILSRSFAEYCILGWENLPRTLLLYYTNFVSSPEGYFQTLICNSETYRNTTVNHDLHYIMWDTPPKQHPRSLGPRDYRRMVLSNRPFARKFKQNNVVLDRIDRDLLKRRRSQFSYGGWCARSEGGDGSCSSMVGENYGVLRPGPGSRRLGSLLKKLVNGLNLNKRQCKWFFFEAANREVIDLIGNNSILWWSCEWA